MKWFLLALFVLFGNPLIAQQSLRSDELGAFQDIAVQHVHWFESMVKRIGETGDKTKAIKAAGDLLKKNATVEVSFFDERKGKDTTYRLPKSVYLQRLSKLTQKYKVVTISFGAVVFKSGFKEMRDRNGDIYYEGQCQFTQCFCAKNSSVITGMSIVKNNEKPEYDLCDYGDCTKKEATVCIERVITEQGEKWILVLGDIKVMQTVPFKG